MKHPCTSALTHLTSVRNTPIVRLTVAFMAFCTAVASGQTAPAPAASSPAKDDTILLSPFAVTSNTDVGFVSASALSGGRTAADLSDTPIGYSVQTQEFLQALNITSLDDAFEWSPNSRKYIDVNSAGVALGTDNMTSSTVRGVQSGAPMRNFFNVSYTLDAYNTERFDYMRGPNSVLFGAGTISGSANTQTKQARVDKSMTDTVLRFDSHGSARFSADLNRRISKTAALRLNILKDNGKTWKDGEIINKQGIDLAILWNITPSTQLRVGGEYGEDLTRTMIRPLLDALSGWDGTVFGLQSFTTSSTDQATYNIHGVSRLGSSATNQKYILSPDHGVIWNYAATVQTAGYGANMRPLDGLTPLLNSNIGIAGAPLIGSTFDLPASSLESLYSVATQNSSFTIPHRSFTNLGGAPVGSNRDKDINLAITQRFGSSFFMELAADYNSRHNYGNGSYWSGDAVTGFGNTYIDINKFTPIGTPNPEFLQAYQQAGPDRRFQDFAYAGAHMAAAYVKKWNWLTLNANTIIGLDRDSQITFREIGVLPINADPRQWGLNNANSFPLYYRHYFDQTLQADAPPIGQPMLVIDPVTGTQTTMTPQWVLSTSRTEGGVLKSWKNLNYGQASLQLSFFDKRFVLLGAAREDQQTAIQKLGLRAMSYPTGWNPTMTNYLWRPDAPANWATLAGSRPVDSSGVPTAASLTQQYQNDYNPPSVETKALTKTIGGVLRIIDSVSVFANYGQTFNPGTVGNVTIDFQSPSASRSDSLEEGIRFRLPNGRLNSQITHFSSQTKNDSGGQPPGYSNLNPIINTTSIANPNSGTNSRGLGNLPYTWVDMRDLKSEGWESETVANLTKQWRLTLNVGTTKATQGNVYRYTRQWLADNTAELTQILTDAGVVITNNIATVPTTGAHSPTAQAGANAWNSLQANAVNWVTGTQRLSRMMMYTGNIFTDYTFNRRYVKGLRLGIGLQYRGPEVIGFQGASTVPDPANPAAAIVDPNHNAYSPVWARSYGIGTITVAYPVKFGKKELNLNLTVNNAFNYKQPVYMDTGLRPYEGNLASPARSVVPMDYNYLEPITFRLSSSFKF